MERVGTIVLVQLPMVDFQDQDGQTVRLLTTVPSGEVLRKLMILSGQGAVLVGQCVSSLRIVSILSLPRLSRICPIFGVLSMLSLL